MDLETLHAMSPGDDVAITFIGIVLICGGAIGVLYIAISICMEVSR